MCNKSFNLNEKVLLPHDCLSVFGCCFSAIIKAIAGLPCLRTLCCNAISTSVLEAAVEVLEKDKTRKLYISCNSAGVDYSEFMSRYEGARIDERRHLCIYKNLAWSS